MQLIKEIEGLEMNNTVVTTGNFDGVHLGHQYLLKELVNIAKKTKRRSVVVMFFPHPREVLSSDASGLRYLSNQEDKYKIFEECGVDSVVEIPFSKELAKWTAEEFVKTILLDKIGMSFFFVGYDHKIGNPREECNLNYLSDKYGFELQQCDPLHTEKSIVSSSVIRNCLLEGDVERASQLLGRFYTIKCTVVQGKRVGRSIGFPTANLKPVFEKRLIPAEGVYAVNVKYGDKRYGGMLHIGYRPTLNDGRGLTVEVHVFDFDDDIYDQIVDVCFVAFMRANKRFDTIEDLRCSIEEDARKAKTLFNLMLIL